VLLFLCKYNIDYAEQKYNSYTYVKMSVVFNPNSRGVWHQFVVRPPCTSVLSDQDLYFWLLRIIF